VDIVIRTCRLPVTLEGILFAAVAWSFSVTPLDAEVMDKEPTVAANWLWAMVGGGWRRPSRDRGDQRL